MCEMYVIILKIYILENTQISIWKIKCIKSFLYQDIFFVEQEISIIKIYGVDNNYIVNIHELIFIYKPNL